MDFIEGTPNQSDASDLGYAAVFGNVWFAGAFSDEERSLNISVRDVYYIAIAIAMWPQRFENKFVFFCGITKRLCILSIIKRQRISQ